MCNFDYGDDLTGMLMKPDVVAGLDSPSRGVSVIRHSYVPTSDNWIGQVSQHSVHQWHHQLDLV